MKASARRPPLWRCPRCGHRFVTRNLWHSCDRYSLGHHFAGRPAFVRELFDHYVRAVRRFGPLRVEPQKTRIVFQVRVRFAGGHPLQTGFRGAFWLTRPRPGPPVDRIEKVAGNCYVHSFLLRRRDDLTDSLVERLGEAYRVGCQLHLRR